MFAVVVLGIGFIMLAAVFPIAIQQSKLTVDETRGAAIARGAVEIIRELAVDGPDAASSIMPPTGEGPTYRGWVAPFQTNLGWNSIRLQQISGEDPRYGWVALYQRKGDPDDPPTWPKTAQLFIIPVQVTTRSAFALEDVEHPLDQVSPVRSDRAVSSSNLYPRYIEVQLQYHADDSDRIIVRERNRGAVTEGAYVIIASANPPSRPDTTYVYRVGVRRADLDSGQVQVWELAPGNDLKVSRHPSTLGAPVFLWALIVGRERHPDGTFVGPAQDIGIYTTFIPIR